MSYNGWSIWLEDFSPVRSAIRISVVSQSGNIGGRFLMILRSFLIGTTLLGSRICITSEACAMVKESDWIVIIKHDKTWKVSNKPQTFLWRAERGKRTNLSFRPSRTMTLSPLFMVFLHARHVATLKLSSLIFMSSNDHEILSPVYLDGTWKFPISFARSQVGTGHCRHREVIPSRTTNTPTNLLSMTKRKWKNTCYVPDSCSCDWSWLRYRQMGFRETETSCVCSHCSFVLSTRRLLRLSVFVSSSLSQHRRPNKISIRTQKN